MNNNNNTLNIKKLRFVLIELYNMCGPFSVRAFFSYFGYYHVANQVCIFWQKPRQQFEGMNKSSALIMG